MADAYIYETSMRSSSEDEYFSEKTWSYQQDTNNGLNGQQIRFDLSGFRSSDKFTAPKEAVIIIPLVMAMSASAAFSGGFQNADYVQILKCGFHQLIQSMSVQVDGKELLQITQNLNQYVSFKMMTESDLNAVKNTTTNFYPDTSDSWVYTGITSSSAGGNGLSNNVVNPIPPATWAGYAATQDLGSSSYYNDGLLMRTKETIRTGSTSKWASLKSASQFQLELKNYSAVSGTAGAASEYVAQYITAVIRLSDVCDLFNKLPLIRGFNSVLLINLNTGSVQINKNATATMVLGGSTPSASNAAASLAIANNGTCPFMVSSVASSWGVATAASTGVFNFGIYYGSVRPTQFDQSTKSIPAHQLNAARIYCPLYQPKPEYAIQYITENKRKVVQYDDIQFFTVQNIGASSNFNVQLASSLTNMKKVVIIPQIAAATLGIREDQSCFDSCGHSTSPLSIYNFNIQLSNKNVFQQNILYGFEQFVEETRGTNAINGALLNSLSSGLISKSDWEAGLYKFYVVDLSKRMKDDISGKSLSVLGSNNNLLAMDLHIFVVQEKTCVIDVETGLVESVSV